MFKNLCFLLLILSQAYTAQVRMLRDGDRGQSRYSYSGSSSRSRDRQPSLIKILGQGQGQSQDSGDQSDSSDDSWGSQNQKDDLLTTVLNVVPTIILKVTGVSQNGFYLSDGSLITIYSQQDSSSCTIQRNMALLLLWKQTYDSSSKVCQATNFQFLQSSQLLYVVFKLRGIENDDKSFHLRQDTNGKEAFNSGLFSNPGSLSSDTEIYLIASVSITDGKLNSGTYIMSKYSQGVISNSKSYTLSLSSLRASDGNILVDGYSNAYPPDTTSVHDQFLLSKIRENRPVLLQFNEDLSQLTGVWQKRQ